jgi:hypothetical protein
MLLCGALPYSILRRLSRPRYTGTNLFVVSTHSLEKTSSAQDVEKPADEEPRGQRFLE